MAEPGKSASSAQASPSRRLGFTLDASTGEIIKVENVDSAGQRHELSKAEKQDLAKERLGGGVEGWLSRRLKRELQASWTTKMGKRRRQRRKKRRGCGEFSCSI
jgi:hypothetical protein